MLRTSFAVLFLCALTLAQEPPQPPSKQGEKPAPTSPAAPKAAAPAASAVAPSAPVITLNAPCTKPTTPAAKGAAMASESCKKVVTREQFEKLVDAAAPGLPAGARRQVAQQYAQVLAMADRAEQAGVDRDPRLTELMKFARLNVLAKFYVQDLQKKAENVSAAEIESYYNANKDKFRQATISRIYVPKALGGKPKPEEEAAIVQLAQKIRDRAAAGEDMTKLEQEAYDQVKATSPLPDAEKKSMTPPPVDLGEVRAGRLPPEHEKVIFALKPGEVSTLLTEPSGYFIYKVVSEGTVPLEKARDEIKQELAMKHFQDQVQGIEKSAAPVFNEKYFGAGAGEAAEPGEAAKPAPAEPGAPPKK